ncbi:PE family protein [Mycobacterium gastri]|uniref:PE domain-containing protein n=1 Tax=Mycobacterium gastri TaxID=1777 RepID=A0A1X1UVE9_MYCGS|nr:PE family protein [Mycobacterium gastri]ETW21325.1 hypothetical protein MGAST_26530 [Mycobacterium gastri 'Wayne']ORV60719.1 hypothetical protein AWC07_18150 [Mycobacterium gastri]
MPWVIAAPEYVAAAANDLAGIGSTLSQANMAALVPISGVLPAGADEVSFAVSALFDAHAQAYQALSAQAALFHEQFVQLMTAGAGQYAAAEAANVLPFQQRQNLAADAVAGPTASPVVGNGSVGGPPQGAGGRFGAGGSVVPAAVSSNGGLSVAPSNASTTGVTATPAAVPPAGMATAAPAGGSAATAASAAAEPAEPVGQVGPAATAGAPLAAPLSGLSAAAAPAAAPCGSSARSDPAVDTAQAVALGRTAGWSHQQATAGSEGPSWSTPPTYSASAGDRFGTLTGVGLFGNGGSGGNGGLFGAGQSASGGVAYGGSGEAGGWAGSGGFIRAAAAPEVALPRVADSG